MSLTNATAKLAHRTDAPSRGDRLDGRSLPRQDDAVELLTRDHEAIRRLFKDCTRVIARRGDLEHRAEVVGRLCFRLSVHFQIEEEVLYPAARGVPSLAPFIGVALHEHRMCRELVAKLDEMEPDAPDYDNTVAALGAALLPHVDAEEEGLFRHLSPAGLDVFALGQRMAQRRRLLQHDVTRIGPPASKAGVTVWSGDCGDRVF